MYYLLYITTDINECVNHTCQNGGSCVDGVNNYSCSCLPGFTGYHCGTGEFFCLFVFCFFIFVFVFSRATSQMLTRYDWWFLYLKFRFRNVGTFAFAQYASYREPFKEVINELSLVSISNNRHR